MTYIVLVLIIRAVNPEMEINLFLVAAVFVAFLAFDLHEYFWRGSQ